LENDLNSFVMEIAIHGKEIKEKYHQENEIP